VLSVGICLGNNLDNFQLHGSTINKNMEKSFTGATFLTHTVVIIFVDSL